MSVTKKDPRHGIKATLRLKLTPEAIDALREYNLKTTGRGVTSDDGYVTDPQVIERLDNLSMPGESPSDVVIRILRQGGVMPQ